MKVLGYARVSTEDQAREGVSLSDQQDRIAAYAVARGFELVGVEVDAGVSAKSLDRPALQRALASLAAGEAQGLIVVKLDRLTRSVKNLGELVEGPFKKASLFSLSESIDTQSAGGRMLLNVLSSISQWEREVIAERTRDGLAYIKRQGGRTGSVSYGFKLVDGWELLAKDDPARKKLHVCEHEQAVMRLVHELHAAAGVKMSSGQTKRLARGSLRAIAAELDRRGIKSRTGKPWLSRQIFRILHGPPLPEPLEWKLAA